MFLSDLVKNSMDCVCDMQISHGMVFNAHVRQLTVSLRSASFRFTRLHFKILQEFDTWVIIAKEYNQQFKLLLVM